MLDAVCKYHAIILFVKKIWINKMSVPMFLHKYIDSCMISIYCTNTDLNVSIVFR